MLVVVLTAESQSESQTHQRKQKLNKTRLRFTNDFYTNLRNNKLTTADSVNSSVYPYRKYFCLKLFTAKVYKRKLYQPFHKANYFVSHFNAKQLTFINRKIRLLQKMRTAVMTSSLICIIIHRGYGEIKMSSPTIIAGMARYNFIDRHCECHCIRQSCPFMYRDTQPDNSIPSTKYSNIKHFCRCSPSMLTLTLASALHTSHLLA